MEDGTEGHQPTPEAVEALHDPAKRFVEDVGPDTAQWLAEAVLVYCQEARDRLEHVSHVTTPEGRSWRIAVSHRGDA